MVSAAMVPFFHVFFVFFMIKNGSGVMVSGHTQHGVFHFYDWCTTLNRQHRHHFTPKTMHIIHTICEEVTAMHKNQ